MEDIQKKIAEVELKFKEQEEIAKEGIAMTRKAQIEMMRLQGEHRALSALLPKEEA